MLLRKQTLLILGLPALALTVTACTQTSKPALGPKGTMGNVAGQVQNCWFARGGGDPVSACW